MLEAVPEHVDALHFLGIARYHRGQRDEGLALVRRALELAPDNLDARNNLGNMLSSRGRLDEAEAAFRQVLERAPDHVHALANLGSVLRRRGDLAGAEAALRRAIALAPNHGEAYHNLVNVLRDLERDDEALEVFAQGAGAAPVRGRGLPRRRARCSTPTGASPRRWRSIAAGSRSSRTAIRRAT